MNARLNPKRCCSVLLTLLCAVGCVDSAIAPVVAPMRAATERGAVEVGVPRKVRQGEARFAELAERAPSSAGFYFDEQGKLVILVRDEHDNQAAIGRMVELVNTNRMTRDGGKRGLSYRVRRASYTFRQLSEWRDVVFDSLFSTRGVTWLDLDEKRNRVAIGLAPEAYSDSRALLEQRLLALGIEPSAVVFDTAGQYRPDVAIATPAAAV